MVFFKMRLEVQNQRVMLLDVLEPTVVPRLEYVFRENLKQAKASGISGLSKLQCITLIPYINETTTS